MRTVVLDTNVLLADPDALLSYPDAEVLLPETVLGEIDKLKTSRVDPELRFRGREVSRILFDLSEDGNLLDGVELPNGGMLRIAPIDSDAAIPDGLSVRNADDRILAVAHQACAAGCEGLTLVTNDLNMLLKAQAFKLNVERREDTADGSWAKRHIVRPFQRYKIPLTILAIAIAVFAGVVAFAMYSTNLVQPATTVVSGVPDEFRDQLSTDLRSLLDGLVALESDPGDIASVKSVANAYYNLRDQTGNVSYAQRAITYYEQYLAEMPDDTAVRTDMAAMYFYTGATDRAIQEATRVLEIEPDHIQANFNLGIFYWRGRQDFEAAALQFTKVAGLTEDGDAHTQLVHQEALANIEAIKQEAEEAGQPLSITGGSI